jgi:hypothetical protein
MGLEPTTPCLQIRPNGTAANTDERIRLVRGRSGRLRTGANNCGRYRLVTAHLQRRAWMRSGFAGTLPLTETRL